MFYFFINHYVRFESVNIRINDTKIILRSFQNFPGPPLFGNLLLHFNIFRENQNLFLIKRLHENVQAVRQETPDPLGRLHRLLAKHIQLIQANAAIPRVVFSEEVFNGNRQRRGRVHEIIRTYLGAVADLIREGQQAGRFRADVPAHTAAVMFLGGLK